ncbi:hypothetical protein OnM2_c4019o27 [Erysiphe neolycopersici]|uniref:Uncharacterized protein n=1 Tax=Erysiphe neolycopersici TaxID=212602 RepID=A0A420HU85_9PEZI|nr:hypothetical protein OnM2_c4019o27 [Erysiphe neolycopersici]
MPVDSFLSLSLILKVFFLFTEIESANLTSQYHRPSGKVLLIAKCAYT